MSSESTPSPSSPSTPAPPRSMPRPWIVFLGAWLVTFALAAVWAIASPIASMPDEPAHLIKAGAVARGELVGTAADGYIWVEVPQYLAETHFQACFAYDVEVTAACQHPWSADGSVMVSAPTTAGRYHPLYYAITGAPSLAFTDVTGIYAMRLVAAAFATVFLALAAAMLSMWRRPAYGLAALAIVVTPMVVYLAAAVNPNAVEFTGTLAAAVALLTIVRAPSGSRLWPLVAILAVSAFFAASTRGVSPLWVAVVLVAILATTPWDRIRELFRRPVIWVGVVLVAAAGISSLAWTMLSGSLTAGTEAPIVGQELPGKGASAIVGFVWVLEQTPTYISQQIGIFGWGDTPAPAIAMITWSAAFVIIALAAVTLLRGRRLLLTLVLLGASIVLPALVQASYIDGGGIIWQGRYSMALFLTGLVIAGALLGDIVPADHRVVRIGWPIMAVALGLGHAVAWLTALRRFSLGSGQSVLEVVFPNDDAWQPPGGLRLVIIAAVLASALFALGTWWIVRRAAVTAPGLTATAGVPEPDSVTPALALR